MNMLARFPDARGVSFIDALAPKVYDGSKWMTRRVMLPQPMGVPASLEEWTRGLAKACHDHNPDSERVQAHVERLRGRVFPFINDGDLVGYRCPYGHPGSILYVRETHYRYGHWELTGKLTNRGKPKWKFVALEGVPARFDEPHPGCLVSRSRLYPEAGNWYKRLGRFMPKACARTYLEVVSVRVERLQDITEADAIAEGTPTGLQMSGQLNSGRCSHDLHQRARPRRRRVRRAVGVGVLGQR